MPSAEIAPELKNLTLPKAAALKSYWKVSMQAIILLAHRLGQISSSRQMSLYKELTIRGYRQCEPVQITPEEPQLISEMLRVHRSDSGKSLTELAEQVGETEDEFRAKYFHGLTGLRLVS
jgi:Zn-dependent peptidase ImmA (M78 family)